MAFGLECRQLLTTHIGTAARHHDGRVPAQDARRTAKRVEPSKFLLELLVWGLCHGRNARLGEPAARRRAEVARAVGARGPDCTKRALRPAGLHVRRLPLSKILL